MGHALEDIATCDGCGTDVRLTGEEEPESAPVATVYRHTTTTGRRYFTALCPDCAERRDNERARMRAGRRW